MVRLCFNFSRGNQYVDVVDELNILHTPNPTPPDNPDEDREQDKTAREKAINKEIDSLKEFLTKHKNQRINFCVYDLDEFTANNMVWRLSFIEDKSNLYLRLPKKHNEPVDVTLQGQLNIYGIPFYYTEIATDWDLLIGLINLGVSDVFVGNILGFELDKVSKVAKEAGVRIRVFPNIAQATWNGVEGVTKFFIRPDDAIFYSKYVDCFELFEAGRASYTNSEVLYDIYKNDKRWIGNLEAIIVHLNTEINNNALDETWAEFRSCCGKSCVKGGTCRICHKYQDLSDNLSEQELNLHHFLTKKLY